MAERRLFLERASFKRRRLGDAARVLPVTAALLLLLPAWWLPKAFASAGAVIWIFSFWAVLIVLIWLLHHALMRAEAAIGPTDPDGDLRPPPYPESDTGSAAGPASGDALASPDPHADLPPQDPPDAL